MKTVFLPILTTVVGLLQSRAVLHLEILALRQQLAVVTPGDRSRPRLRRRERISLGQALPPLAGLSWDADGLQGRHTAPMAPAAIPPRLGLETR